MANWGFETGSTVAELGTGLLRRALGAGPFPAGAAEAALQLQKRGRHVARLLVEAAAGNSRIRMFAGSRWHFA